MESNVETNVQPISLFDMIAREYNRLSIAQMDTQPYGPNSEPFNDAVKNVLAMIEKNGIDALLSARVGEEERTGQWKGFYLGLLLGQDLSKIGIRITFTSDPDSLQ